MKLQPAPFDKIKSGEKTIEVRLFDEKRRLLEIGDEVTFLKEPEKAEEIKATIIGLLRYKSFSDLANDFEATVFGAFSKEDLLNSVYNYYTKENEEKFGVLGIRLELK